MSLCNIEINESSAILTYKEHHRMAAVTSKSIDIADLGKVLAANVEMDSGLIYTPPTMQIKRYMKKGSSEMVLIEEAPRKRKIKHYDCGELEIMLPRLVYGILHNSQLSGRSALNMRIGTVKGPIITGKEPIYRFFFPNVYDTGTICWGYSRDRNEDSLNSITYALALIESFWGGVSNNDLYRSPLADTDRIKSDKLGLDYCDKYLKYIATLDQYPEEFIHSPLSSKVGFSVNNFCSLVLGNSGE